MRGSFSRMFVVNLFSSVLYKLQHYSLARQFRLPYTNTADARASCQLETIFLQLTVHLGLACLCRRIVRQRCSGTLVLAVGIGPKEHGALTFSVALFASTAPVKLQYSGQQASSGHHGRFTGVTSKGIQLPAK